MFHPRGTNNWDPFHEFFLWLATNQTGWCETAANYYETMLVKTKYCPGIGSIAKDFCTDFTQAYVDKCVTVNSAADDNKIMVAVFVVALACALLSGFITNRTMFIPESAISMLIGLIAGILVYTTATRQNQNVQAAHFDASIFFLILVPPIALQSLLEVRTKYFCRNLPSIMWLAILNTVMTCVSVGFIVYFATNEEMDMPTCLLIGAISSSVDPTAVRVSLEKRIRDIEKLVGNKKTKVIQRLHDLDATIFGESTLNDGVSFVLYTSLLPLVIGPSKISKMSLSSSTPTDILSMTPSSSLTPLERTAGECIVEFFHQYTLSFLVGIVSGFLSALIFKLFTTSCNLRGTTSENTAARRGMVVYIALALLPYFLCVLLNLSGLVGLCGSTFVIISFTNFSLSKNQREGVLHITRVWSKLTEFFIFSYLGFCITIPFQKTNTKNPSDVKFIFDWKLILITCIACLISRLWIIILGSLTNICRKKSVQFELRGLFIMWWSGLRGPVCFALALNVPHYNYVTGIGTTNAPKIAATMTSVVVFTTFVLGGLSFQLLRCLYSDQGRDDDIRNEGGEDELEENLIDQPERPLVALAIRANRGPFRKVIHSIHESLYHALVSEPPPPPPTVQSEEVSPELGM